MKKKVIIGTVLFIAVGLFMFTFANPNEKVDDKSSSKQTVKEVSSEDVVSNEGQEKVEPKKEENAVNNNANTNNQAARRRKSNTNTAPVVAPVVNPVAPATDNNNNEDAAKKEAEEKAKKEAEELSAYKDAAKKELVDYSKTVTLDETTKKQIVDEYLAKIDEATTKPAVDQALTDGKKALDDAAKKEAEDKAKKEAEDLQAAKDAAKKELAEYKKDVDFSDINDQKVTDIKNDGYTAIDNAKTKEEVAKELKDAKDLIDALDTVAPVITLEADATIIKKVGKANLDNYTVTDNVSKADKITVSYEIKLDNRKAKDVDYNVIGTYKITYTATDEAGNTATKTRTITVIPVKAESLVLKAGNVDVTNATDTYIKGQNAKTITVYLKYNNGELKKLDQAYCYGFMMYYTCTNGYTVSGSVNTNSVTNKTQTITYSYNGVKSVTYNYNVIARKVETLEIISNNNTYVQDKNFDIKVNATWNDGTVEKNVRYTTTANTNTVGDNQTAIITYKDASAEYNYNVIAKAVESLEVITTKTRYLKNDPLDIKVNAKWNDGSVEKNVAYAIDQDTKTIGNKNATISYKGATANYKFSVVEIQKLEVISSTTEYIKGEKLDIKVNAIYSDGEVEKDVAYSIDKDTKTVGKKEATISYKGVTAKYTFNVKYELHLVSDIWYGKYLEFDESVRIKNIKYYNKDGKNTFTIGGGNASKIYSLTTEQYNELQKMDGTNPKQRLVVSVKEGNKNVEYIYTMVIHQSV